MVTNEETVSRKCEACTPKKNENKPTQNLFESKEYRMMNGRPEEKLQDGVWVCVNSNIQQSQPIAVQNAEIEQRRILSILQEKENKITKFQRETKLRVSRFVKAQQELIEKENSQNIKQEQELLYKSTAAADYHTPKKNSCLYNISNITIDAAERRLKAEQQPPALDDNCASSALLMQSEKVSKSHAAARMKLMGKKITDEEAEAVDIDESLPGGLWGTSATRDKSGARLFDVSRRNQQTNTSEPEHDHLETISARSAPHDVAIAAVQEGIVSSPGLSARLKDIHFDTSDELPPVLPTTSVTSDDFQEEDELPTFLPPASSLSKSKVHFKKQGHWQKREVTPCEAADRPSTMVTCMNADAVKVHRCHFEPLSSVTNLREVPPFVAPGAVEYKQKKMQEKNRLLCRRVFSKMEREGVKEDQRKRNHRIHVERLKAEKERLRLEAEKQQEAAMDALQMESRVKEEEEYQKKKQQEENERKVVEKNKKMQRYAVALKSQIHEKLSRLNIALPPLCCCTDDFWSTDPMRCANNCVFYRNNAAYTKALQSVLQSVERNMCATNRDSLHHQSVIILDAEEDANVTFTLSNQ